MEMNSSKYKSECTALILIQIDENIFKFVLNYRKKLILISDYTNDDAYKIK